jgi:hypothetical protein
MENKLECKLCNKFYCNKTSLSNHNRNVHGIKKYKLSLDNCCQYCNKNFSCYKSKWRHQKTCTQQQLNIPETIKNEMEKIKEENERLKEDKKKSDEIIRLQKKLINCKRLDTKTFKAANKILMERSYNHSYNNNTNSNNTINNNIHFVSIGNEDLKNVLTKQQKRQIIDARRNSIEKIVEIAHCGNINQCKNIVITNLKDNFAYKYDEQKGYFVSITKNELLEELITRRMTDIEEIYDELEATNKISDLTKKLICIFLEKMNNHEEPYTDTDNDIKYNNLKSYKKHNIKILLYNNQDKIAKDIYMRITDNVPPSS